MSDPVAWLRVQLDEEERVAQVAAEDWLHVGVAVVAGEDGVPFAAPDSMVDHIARQSPRRALLAVERDRLLLELHKHCNASCYIVRVLTLPFCDLPGWLEEWRP